jgi:hypothetical protein
MQIFIKNKRTTVYEINKLDTIEFLQDQIYDKEGIPSKYYYLVHNGKILDSNLIFIKSWAFEKISPSFFL